MTTITSPIKENTLIFSFKKTAIYTKERKGVIKTRFAILWVVPCLMANAQVVKAIAELKVPLKAKPNTCRRFREGNPEKSKITIRAKMKATA